MNLQHQIIILNLIQLHLFSVSLAISIILVFMNLEIEESDAEDVESQLDQNISNLNEDSADTFIQTLWEQVKINNKFTFQIIEKLRNEAHHHNKILLIECKEHQNYLYFQERKYVFNLNQLCLCIIQLAHNSVVNDHSERAKCYELINWVYW